MPGYFIFISFFPNDTIFVKSEVLLFEGCSWPVKFVGNKTSK